MKAWVYIQSESKLWTVGFYAPDGQWHTDSDHRSKQSAAERVAWLNGYNPSLDQALNENDGVYRP